MGEEEMQDEARELLAGIGVSSLQEASIAIKVMVDNLVEAGMSVHHALFWSAVHVAALAKMPDEDE